MEVPEEYVERCQYATTILSQYGTLFEPLLSHRSVLYDIFDSRIDTSYYPPLAAVVLSLGLHESGKIKYAIKLVRQYKERIKHGEGQEVKQEMLSLLTETNFDTYG